MPLADDLAAYAADLSYGDLSDETVSAAKKRLIDAIACTFPAMDAEPVQQVLHVAGRKQGERNAPVIGASEEYAVEYAALANGTLIRYLDWNDTYLAKEPAHPSDNLGAILPVAFAYDRSGQDILTAMTLAYELQCRLCDAASLRANGFDHVNYGLISATLAAGWLMDLSEEELVEAVNTAVNSHVVLRQDRAGELTPWKGIAFANVARNAVLSCQLAAEGLPGPAPIFEGRFGVFNQLTGEFSLDTGAWGGNEGVFKVERSYIKYYPVEYHAQAAVECALTLREKHGLEPGDIKRVENETYEAAVSIIGAEAEKWRPKTRETADHSMPYCIARAFIDGEMTLEQFAPEKIRDDTVRAVMDRIEVEENENFTKRYGARFPHRMVVHTRTGERHTCTIEHPKGHPENPLTRDELDAKFRRNADGVVPEERTAALLDKLHNLEQQNTLNDLADMFRMSQRPPGSE